MDNPWRHEVDAALARRGGVLLTSDLARIGLSSDDIELAVSDLARVRRGAYVRQRADDPREIYRQRVRSAALQPPGDRVVSHLSAAMLHGFAVADEHLDWIHLTQSVGRTGRRNGVHTHIAPLLPSEVDHVDGVAATSPRRTVIDCARMLPLVEGVVIADQALSQGLVTLDELLCDADEMRRRPGSRVARAAIALADAGGESPGETRMRLILVRGGCEFDTQVEIYDARESLIGRVDIKLRRSAVVLEFDGREKYSLNGNVELAHWKEKLRHDRLFEAGYIPIRVVWAHLAHPGWLLQRVRQAEERADQDQRAS